MDSVAPMSTNFATSQIMFSLHNHQFSTPMKTDTRASTTYDKSTKEAGVSEEHNWLRPSKAPIKKTYGSQKS